MTPIVSWPWRSPDYHRRADGHQLGQPQYVGVAHPNATVGDCSRNQAWLIGPVDADVAAGGPVRERCRTCAGPKRDRTVGRAAVARQDVANVEIARRCCRVRFPTPTGALNTRTPSRNNVALKRLRSTTRRVSRSTGLPSAERGTHPVVPFGSTASRTRCQSPPASSRALPRSCKTFVVPSGVRRETPVIGEAPRRGATRAVTARLITANSETPRSVRSGFGRGTTNAGCDGGGSGSSGAECEPGANTSTATRATAGAAATATTSRRPGVISP